MGWVPIYLTFTWPQLLCFLKFHLQMPKKEEKKTEHKKESAQLPLLALPISSTPLITSHWGMCWGPAHILFAQCIPAGSLFMSIFLLIRVRLPLVTLLRLLLSVKEPTCDTRPSVCFCVCTAIWEPAFYEASLLTINMAKWLAHMVKYSCKVIRLVAEARHIWLWSVLQMALPALTHTYAHTVWRWRGEWCELYILGFSAWLLLFLKRKWWSEAFEWVAHTLLREKVTHAWLLGLVSRSTLKTA